MVMVGPEATHAIRETIGAFAFFAASASTVVRYMISRGAPAPEKMTHRVSTVAGICILVGVGWGQFAHPYTPIYLGSLWIIIGVVASNVAIALVWRSARLGRHEKVVRFRRGN